MTKTPAEQVDFENQGFISLRQSASQRGPLPSRPVAIVAKQELAAALRGATAQGLAALDAVEVA